MSTPQYPSSHPDPLGAERQGLRDETFSETKDPSDMMDQAREQKDRAASAVHSAADKADEQRERAASGVDSAVEQVRERAADLPGGEKTTQLAYGAADQMEKAAEYLRDHDVSSMGEDVVSFVKAHPKESIVVALAAGLLLGRALRS